MPSKKKTLPITEKLRHTDAPEGVPGEDEFLAEHRNEWIKLKVRPALEWMAHSSPPEAGIGTRIAYCRGQLDNLSLEALARFTKRFDAEGVSRQSLVRYEANSTLPGARELRILTEALWVPAGWLITGKLEGVSAAMAGYKSALRGLLIEMKAIETFGSLDIEATAEEIHIQQRQRWLFLARQAQPRQGV